MFVLQPEHVAGKLEMRRFVVQSLHSFSRQFRQTFGLAVRTFTAVNIGPLIYFVKCAEVWDIRVPLGIQDSVHIHIQ